MPAAGNGTTDDHRIWGFAFGYFACYAPYSALTKALSEGALPGLTHPIGGFELLPVSTITSLVCMAAFLTGMGWWKHAGTKTVLGVKVPFPGRWTFLSGLCTAAIIATTTLAYTFSGVSIVFMMLLMRGGLLIIAPIVDALSRRRVQWTSWCALGLSLAALFVASSQRASYELTVIAMIDVAVYLAAYVVRLRFMSHMAKSPDREASIRYFVEEQMVATPAIVLLLVVLAIVGRGAIMEETRRGFTDYWSSGGVMVGMLVGALSQGTGVFGGLILLDAREHSFCVPVNRASSVLAGVVASLALTRWGDAPPVPTSEYVSVSLIVLAIVILAWRTLERAWRRPHA
jgi:hypothetical protein